MHYRVGEVERVQRLQTHYGGHSVLERSVDGGRGARGTGSREFLFYFDKVCALCLSAER